MCVDLVFLEMYASTTGLFLGTMDHAAAYLDHEPHAFYQSPNCEYLWEHKRGCLLACFAHVQEPVLNSCKLPQYMGTIARNVHVTAFLSTSCALLETAGAAGSISFWHC